MELKNITKSFGPVKAVDNVSLIVSKGDSLAIIGESGSGKSTLAKLMIGLIKPDSGEVIAERDEIQMVFQDPYTSLDPLFDIRGILKEAFYKKKVPASIQEDRMKEILEAVGLPTTILHRFPHEFSGGERQRIAIARALLAGGKTLILDEATSSLDVLMQKQIIDLLIKIKQEFKLTYIFISHNLRVVQKFSDKIAIMRQGQIIEMAPKDVLFSKPSHGYTQQLLSAAFHYV